MSSGRRVYVLRNGICHHIISILPSFNDRNIQADMMKQVFKAGYIPELLTVEDAMRDFNLMCDCHLTPVEKAIKETVQDPLPEPDEETSQEETPVTNANQEQDEESQEETEEETQGA